MEIKPEVYGKGEDQVKYIELKEFIEQQTIKDINKLLPAFSYNKYLKIREEVLEAEQHLLRIIDFDTRNEQKVGFVMLMCYLQYLNCSIWLREGSPRACQLAYTIYNDLVYLQISTKNHKTYTDYYKKARELVWAALRSTYIIGTDVIGVEFSSPVDEGMLDKFQLDRKKIDSIL